MENEIVRDKGKNHEFQLYLQNIRMQMVCYIRQSFVGIEVGGKNITRGRLKQNSLFTWREVLKYCAVSDENPNPPQGGYWKFLGGGWP